MNTSQPCENSDQPVSKVAQYYRRMMKIWQNYGFYHLFCYFDISDKKEKPALILGCGEQEVKLNVKSVVMLRAALQDDPKLLDKFIDDWLLTHSYEEEPKSSNFIMPKRLKGRRPSLANTNNTKD